MYEEHVLQKNDLLFKRLRYDVNFILDDEHVFKDKNPILEKKI